VEPEQVVRALFAAFERRDAARMGALVADEFTFHAPTAELLRGGEPYRGPDGIRRYLADVARQWERLEVEVDEVRVRGDRAVALGRVRVLGGGQVVDSPAGWAFRTGADGRLVSGRVFETRTAALEAFARDGS